MIYATQYKTLQHIIEWKSAHKIKNIQAYTKGDTAYILLQYINNNAGSKRNAETKEIMQVQKKRHKNNRKIDIIDIRDKYQRKISEKDITYIKWFEDLK